MHQIVKIIPIHPKKSEKEISKCDKKDVEIFHSGTKNSKNRIVTSGGRVLSITARSTKLKKARKKAYEIVRKLKWKKEYHRSDIAKKL